MTHNPEAAMYFAHERLAAHQLALGALKMVAGWKRKLHGLPGGLGPQLERATVGAFSNFCAGASARGAEGKRHFHIALSEAGEAGGCAEGAFVLGALTDAEHAALRSMLLRLCACLHGLAS